MRPLSKSNSIFLLSVMMMLACAPLRAATFTVLPDLPDMRMIDLEILWNDQPGADWDVPRDYSQGGSIRVGGITLAPHIYTEAPQRLAQYGWPLENAGPFSVGDTFGSPFDVLNGMAFGRSFGWSSWLSADAISKGYRWKIVQTAASPGFKCYNPYSPNFEELHTSASGFAVTWDGHYLINGVQQYDDPATGTNQGWNGPNWMLHPVFAAPAQPGNISADYTIYLVDGNGAVVPNITPGYAKLKFSVFNNILHAVPMQGGMVMPMVSYNAASGKVGMMLGSTIPQLTPLLVSNPGDCFDPADPWFDALDPSRQGQAFSRRYGFVMGSNSDPAPTGTAIWIRKLSSSPGLGIYLYRPGPPAVWQPIFGTAGSSPVWQWDGTMFHPGVAAPAGTNQYTAVFQAFLADTATGAEVPGSASDPLTFTWTTVPDGRPTVGIDLKVAVSWPASATNYVLEAATSVATSDWATVTNQCIILDGQPTVLFEANQAPQFFRLRQGP